MIPVQKPHRIIAASLELNVITENSAKWLPTRAIHVVTMRVSRCPLLYPLQVYSRRSFSINQSGDSRRSMTTRVRPFRRRWPHRRAAATPALLFIVRRRRHGYNPVAPRRGLVASLLAENTRTRRPNLLPTRLRRIYKGATDYCYILFPSWAARRFMKQTDGGRRAALGSGGNTLVIGNSPERNEIYKKLHRLSDHLRWYMLLGRWHVRREITGRDANSYRC